MGAFVSLLFLDYVPVWLGWRLAFGIGALVGLAIIFARHHVPESPRWLLTHGRKEEAQKIMDDIEIMAVGEAGRAALPEVKQHMTFQPTAIGYGTIVHTIVVRFRRRAILGLILISSQAFFYNGITFTYPLVLKRFFHVLPEHVPAYGLWFALGNFLGPLVLGHFFDTFGRRIMIGATYALSGLLIIGIECLFLKGALTAATQTGLLVGTCFFASAAASAGYLTVSEVFPLEMRALAISLFYVIGTTVGGLLTPVFFGALVETDRRGAIATGYVLGAVLMLAAAVAEWFLGVDSEGKSLEDVAMPLTAETSNAAAP